MKTLLARFAAIMIAIVGFAALTSQAAQAYPFPTLTITAPNSVPSGATFNASTSSSATCTTISESFSGQSASAAGSTVSGSFTAPTVTAPTNVPLTAKCTFPSTTAKRGLALAATSQTVSRTVNVLVEPVANAGGTGMPNTGGPSIWLWVAGFGALLLGGVTMVVGRRRRHAAA